MLVDVTVDVTAVGFDSNFAVVLGDDVVVDVAIADLVDSVVDAVDAVVSDVVDGSVEGVVVADVVAAVTDDCVPIPESGAACWFGVASAPVG